MASYYWSVFIKIILTVTGILVRTVLILSIFLLLPYLNTSIYDFPEPAPFSGTHWHNPYATLDTNHWYTANFHAHGQAWLGLSNGKGNDEDLYHAYFNRLGYDILGISNYQRIDEVSGDSYRKIPTYEHGYSPTKNHQVVIGADHVCWREYPLYQGIHQKQHILKTLRAHNPPNAIVAIAHPKRGMAYSWDDMNYLTGYDCLEAFNHLSTSKKHWDMALSSGHPVYLISSDDCHDFEDLTHIARHITLIHSEDTTRDAILQALRDGHTYGVEIQIDYLGDFQRRKQMIDSLEKVKRVEVIGDEFFVQFSDTCDSIIFVGQNGAIKKVVLDQLAASYEMTPEDTYIRTEVRFKKSHHYFFLNPVLRSNGNAPEKRIAIVNNTKTTLYHIFIICCLLIPVVVFYYLERKKWPRTSYI